MQDIDNVWGRIQNLPSRLIGLGKKADEDVQELSDLLILTGNEPMRRNCPSCINKAYQLLTSYTYEKLKAMSDTKAKLKPGIMPYFQHTHFTKDNLTDDVAREMIASNPVNAELFEVLPDEVKETKAKAKDKAE